MSRADELRAELTAAELEEQLVAAKEAGDVPEGLKHALRAARETHRTLRQAEPAEGDAVASPDAIEAKVEVD